MNIDLERLKTNLQTIGGIGRVETGGIDRLAFSPQYDEAAGKLLGLFARHGLKTEIDAVGNVIGRREGAEDLPAILIGSHLDTVKNGGLFDGALGVLAALECVSTLNDNQIRTDHPIEIVAFNAEEGSEMGGTFGSRVLIGNQNLAEPGLADKLSRYELTLDDLARSMKDPASIAAFLELHIEQGGFLDTSGIPIGVVSGIAGITRYAITISGEANHAGTTPMDLRRDALTMAARLLVEIDAIAHRIGRPFVSTVGQLNVKPGSVNVIPGEVELVLEMRDMDRGKIAAALEQIRTYTSEFPEYRFAIRELIDKPTVQTDAGITELIRQACIGRGIAYEVMPSGAGHDAKELAAKVPIGMIFVPSQGGKSHCPEESTDWADAGTGVQILFDTLIALDKEI